MAEVRFVDHAVPNGDGSVDPSAASPGGMTNDEKVSVAGVLARDESKGAAVHAFNPDASPEEKAALAGHDKALLSAIPGVDRLRHHKEDGRAVVVDTSLTGSGPAPTVSLDDVDKASRAEGQVAGGDQVPGSIPAGTAPPVPTWMQSGWRQVAKLDVTGEKTRDETSILAEYLSEQMYGAWWHNAGIIIFAVVVTRFLTAVNLGWGWVLLVLASCASYYTLSISRTRHRARDDIQRELVKTRLVTETESADWLNGFLDRFWLIYEPVLSQTIVASVDEALAANTPGFCESLRLTTFTLGTKAPRIDYVRTFPKTPEDVVIMDWALSFTPNDLQDITPRQAAKRVNPKIVLAIRLGKGGISKNFPILLEDMSFTGRMRVKLKLMTNFPHVQTIDLSFIEKPTFDYVLKPLGGDTFGFDINNIPGLAPFIRDQVHANLGPMMYDPNVFTIDLQALLSGTPLDSAIGVLKVTILDARGLKAVKLGGGAPDPYVSLALGAKPAIDKTKTIPSTSNPSWHETHFILINSLADVLNLALWDYNDHRPDNLLGTVTQELATLNDDAEQEGLMGKIISGGKDRGELRYDLAYFPVLQPTKAADGTIEPLPETATGIVRLTLLQAKDLDVTRAHGDVNPFAKVFLGGSRQPIHTTPIVKRNSNPIWESHCEFLVPEKHNSSVSIQIIDSKEYAADPTLGSLTVKLVDLLEAKERQQDWLPLANSRAGKIRLTAEWKPVAMTGAISGANSYVPPIGILRLWLKRAVDLKNVEAALGGKSDPYVRILGKNKILARTEVINNNLNPEWDQIVYVPVHTLRENLILEVMDYQNLGKDRTLGHVEISISDFAQESGDPAYPFKSTGYQERSDRVKYEKSYKGQLIYAVDFNPAMSLKGGVSFHAEKNELELAAEEANTTSNGGPAATNGHRTMESVGGQSVQSVLTNGSAPSADQSLSNVGQQPPSAVPSNGSIDDHRPSQSNGGQSVQSAQTDLTAGSKAGGETTATKDPATGVEMTPEQLLACPSGILVFQVISGQIARKGSLEVMFDDGYWPSFTSTRARTNHPTWDQIGEGFVRELDYGRIWLRLNAADENSKEEIIAEFRADTRDFVRDCLNKPQDVLLSQPDGSNRSIIRMTAKYVPVDIKLEPRESIMNMGLLRVEVVSAKGLMAADRSGKSDPYIFFELNGQRVFKSETKKKTLSPVWNEAFEVAIPSRTASKFTFEINDWDRVGSATHLGEGILDLASLEPFEQTSLEIPVKHQGTTEKGTLSLRVLFQPEIIARSRGKTTTITTAGRAISTVGGVPLGIGKGVVHGGVAVVGGVEKGIGSVGGFAGRRIGLMKKKDKSGKEVSLLEEPIVTPENGNGGSGSGFDIPAGQVSQPAYLGGIVGVPTGSAATTLPPGDGHAPSDAGTLTITVVSAKDLKGDNGLKPYVQLKLGGKTHKTGHVKGVEADWNESFHFNVAPGTSVLGVAVLDHRTLGKDPEIGEAEVDVSNDFFSV
ncbi:C2 domain-containing protein [Naematelia encephala]|uniref:C2 domain-containing protein n=1 Tax=Naematelia encephala TaxID=71784 RepID=A0A1Y2BAY2_9TREE|nr:C2 domain-containing protein [Naematelia encephala]